MIEPMERFPDENCALCHRSPPECICPQCPECGSQGDPKCYGTHFPLPAAPESKGLDLEAAKSKLRQWEELWGPVLDFAQAHGTDLGIRLGHSIPDAVLEMLKARVK